ncbi:MAG: tetratricopeptide repeat protein [Acidobacteriota bacterium]
MTAEDWNARVTATWDEAASLPEAEVLERIDALAAERSDDDPAAAFERASARDFVGLESEAEVLYRQALASEELDGYRRARATIQLASTLRILGKLEESERLLVALLDRHVSSEGPRQLHDEARAFLALTWVAQGRAAEAAGLVLSTLSPHLSRYHRSVSGNAAELVETSWD